MYEIFVKDSKTNMIRTANLVTKVWMPQMSNYFYSVFVNYFENFEKYQ